MGKYAGREELHDIYLEFNSEHEAMISHKERSGAEAKARAGLSSLLPVTPFVAATVTTVLLTFLALTRVALIRPALLDVTTDSAHVEIVTDLEETDVSYPLSYMLVPYLSGSQDEEEPVTPGGWLRLTPEEVEALGDPVLQGEVVSAKEELLFEHLDNRYGYLLLFTTPDKDGVETLRKEALFIQLKHKGGGGSGSGSGGETTPPKDPTSVVVTPGPADTATPTPTPTETPTPTPTPTPTETPTPSPTTKPYTYVEPTPTMYTVSLSTIGGQYGTGYANGHTSSFQAEKGTVINLTWEPNDIETDWGDWPSVSSSDGSVDLTETESGASFTLTANTSVTFKFFTSNEFYYVYTSSDPNGGGTVEASEASPNPGDWVTVSAMPESGYEFDNWTYSGGVMDPYEDSDHTLYFQMGYENANVVAHFKEIIYNFSIVASPEAGGTVDSNYGGSGGNSIRFDWEAKPGYHYTGITTSGDYSAWELNAEDGYGEVTITSDFTVTVNFEADPTYTVTVHVDPEAAASETTITGKYTGDVVTITPPSANTGYIFTGMGDVTGTTVYDTSARTVTIQSSNVDVTMNYTLAEYSFTYTSSGSGEVWGPDSATIQDSPVTIEVEATEGNHIVSVTANGTTIYTGSGEEDDYAEISYPLGDATNVAVVATFAENPVYYTVYVLPDPSEGAPYRTYTGEDGQTISFSPPAANDGWAYAGTYSGEGSSDYSDHHAKIEGDDVTIYLNYVRTYTVTIVCDPEGVATGYSFQAANGTNTFTIPTPISGWHYYGCEATGTEVHGTSFTVDGSNVTITLYYEEDSSSTPDLYTIHYPECSGGSIYGPEKAAEGYTVNVTAEAAPGYHIASMTVGGTSVSVGESDTIKSHSFTMPASDVYCSATFEGDMHHISYSVPGSMGSYSGPEYARTDETIGVTIIAAPGFHISSISYNGESVTVSNPSETTFSRTVSPSGASVSASFEADSPSSYTITPSAGTGGSISVQGSAAEGASVSGSVTADSGYRIASITVDGTPITPSGEYYSPFSLTMPGHNIIVSATFEAE